ncbi:MAG: dihydroorotate dehydrogenase-like protein [Chloroflexi bacterium]|nr:dihydroorotate dehydrogenase-like protein [Chloroflexota bacterium]
MDISTTYLGLQLKNPIVASASPLSKKLDGIRRLEDAGASAVVMYSLFEEQIIHESLSLDHYLNHGTESYPESLTYFPDLENYNVGPEDYLELIQKAKRSVSIPIIGSLNGVSTGGWIKYAKKIEEAGADALELNFYNIPTDVNMTSQELEQSYIDLVSDIRSQIHIPLAVKLSPFFTALPNLAHRLVQAGTNGLVLFNRFVQPDLDIETLEVSTKIPLSSSSELRLPLRWIAILYGRVQADFALTSGVHTAHDVLKAMMAGANVTMLASSLLQNGVDHINSILVDMKAWMEMFEYQSIQQMRGSMSQQNAPDPTSFERGSYMKALASFDNR